MSDWMETHTGRAAYPLQPETAADWLDIEDIAHALGMVCRYGGHITRFYSVAEHSVLLSGVFSDPGIALWALLHDSAEAYLGDVIRPLKQAMPGYRATEDRLLQAIARWADLPDPDAGIPEMVKDADTRVMVDERAAVKPPGCLTWITDDLPPLGVIVTGWAPAEAKDRFLDRYADLMLIVAGSA